MMQAASSCRPQLEGTGLVQVSCIDVVSRHLTRLGLLLASSCTAAGGGQALVLQMSFHWVLRGIHSFSVKAAYWRSLVQTST